jgi:phage terminase large subunit-like protein
MSKSKIDGWRADPIGFIETVLHNPETGKPFQLLAAERDFLAHAFKFDADGRLLYPEMVFAAIKKSGKTGFAAMFMLTMVLLFGGRFAEGYCIANDLEQAASRVFQAVRRIVEASPLLRPDAKITADKITFAAFHGAMISAVACDYTGMAGANPTISIFDELWGFVSENSRRLWDEMVPPPTRKVTCRLVVTYAGFSGESVLLEELHKRGMAQPEVGPCLYAGDGILMAWHHAPIAPWQTAGWIAEMRRSLRPNQFLRMIENKFVTSESSFVSMTSWDACVDPALAPVFADKNLIVDIGVDASVKHDSTAIVATTALPDKRVRLVTHRIFQPTPDQPLDFEATVEATLIDLCNRFAVRSIYFDPYQMQAVAQRLQKRGLPVREFRQTVPNLTLASQGL